ncbi:hypothetical protein B0H11DRAFT_1898281 [Mycena galericulata]|nr:hypothetical protein B0H11DRAFT_1898281 [Mycena galericulata]
MNKHPNPTPSAATDKTRLPSTALSARKLDGAGHLGVATIGTPSSTTLSFWATALPKLLVPRCSGSGSATVRASRASVGVFRLPGPACSSPWLRLAPALLASCISFAIRDDDGQGADSKMEGGGRCEASQGHGHGNRGRVVVWSAGAQGGRVEIRGLDWDDGEGMGDDNSLVGQDGIVQHRKVRGEWALGTRSTWCGHIARVIVFRTRKKRDATGWHIRDSGYARAYVEDLHDSLECEIQADPTLHFLHTIGERADEWEEISTLLHDQEMPATATGGVPNRHDVLFRKTFTRRQEGGDKPRKSPAYGNLAVEQMLRIWTILLNCSGTTEKGTKNSLNQVEAERVLID